MNDNENTPTVPAWIVIGSAGCGPCIATVRALDARGVVYVKHDVDELTDEQASAARAAVPAGDRVELPVVITPERTWTGFRPDYIDSFTVPKEGR
ncbi:glutaredoxin family protein [Microbacterium sp. NPDC089698]|uniref:glutaredoxin family protein n=1 Tax=Microbacterium sp. NPDC089698 TaxID=3364200 RepID=UPI003807216A